MDPGIFSGKSGLIAAPSDLLNKVCWTNAQKISKDFGGYDDWYLPNQDELKLLYSARDRIGLNADLYRGSSEAQEGSAYYLRYSVITDSRKSFQYYVRLIRKVCLLCRFLRCW